MDGVVVGWMPESAGVRSCPLQVMLSQRKIKARRKRRKELFLGQMCFMGLLLMVVCGLSHVAESAGESICVAKCQCCVLARLTKCNIKFKKQYNYFSCGNKTIMMAHARGQHVCGFECLRVCVLVLRIGPSVLL